MAKQDRLSTLLILLAALIATLPLFVHGCSCGHDLDFHLISWQDASAQFARGNFHPRWATTPGWGAGEPRFIFYPPLSWTLGGLLTLLAVHLHGHYAPADAFALTPALFTLLALSAAGLCMRRLARQYVSPAAATVAATVYLANPYTLFTAYERTAFAELLAAAWMPLLLAAVLPSFAPRGWARSLPLGPVAPLRPPPSPHLPVVGTAVPFALLWLTNAPAAVIGSYALGLIVICRLGLLLSVPGSPHERWRRARPLLLRALLAISLGLALAAFFIVPAATERRWVSIDLAFLPGLRPVDNTLFHHIGDLYHDQVLHTASSIAVLLLGASAAALLAQRVWPRQQPAPATLPLFYGSSDKDLFWLLAALALLIAFLLTPLSLPLWRHLPELRFLQFPWRLLSLLAPVAVLSASRLLRRLRLRPLYLSVLALALPALLAAPAFHLFHLPCDPEDTPQASFALVHELDHQQPVSNLENEPADNPTDEYTPLTADNELLRQNNPPVRVLPRDASDDLPPPPDAVGRPAPLDLDLVLAAPTRIVLNLRDYPLWVVRNNGEIVPDHLQRDDGLLGLNLPAGPAHLVLSLRTPPLERAAEIVTLLAVCVLLGLCLVHRSSTQP